MVSVSLVVRILTVSRLFAVVRVLTVSSSAFSRYLVVRVGVHPDIKSNPAADPEALRLPSSSSEGTRGLRESPGPPDPPGGGLRESPGPPDPPGGGGGGLFRLGTIRSPAPAAVFTEEGLSRGLESFSYHNPHSLLQHGGAVVLADAKHARTARADEEQQTRTAGAYSLPEQQTPVLWSRTQALPIMTDEQYRSSPNEDQLFFQLLNAYAEVNTTPVPRTEHSVRDDWWRSSRPALWCPSLVDEAVLRGGLQRFPQRVLAFWWSDPLAAACTTAVGWLAQRQWCGALRETIFSTLMRIVYPVTGFVVGRSVALGSGESHAPGTGGRTTQVLTVGLGLAGCVFVARYADLRLLREDLQRMGDCMMVSAGRGVAVVVPGADRQIADGQIGSHVGAHDRQSGLSLHE